MRAADRKRGHYSTIISLSPKTKEKNNNERRNNNTVRLSSQCVHGKMGFRAEKRVHYAVYIYIHTTAHQNSFDGTTDAKLIQS